MLSAAAVLVFAAIAVAVPVAEEPALVHLPLSRRSLTLPNGDIDTVAFLESLNSTLNKYHAQALPSYGGLLSGLKARNNLPLKDQVSQGEDSLYYGNAVVGAKNNKPQTFTVDFDTGSADFFVPGPSCSSSQGCVGSTKYDEGGQKEGNTTSVTYGSGSITGENYFDTVEVAGLTAKHTNVVALTSASGFSSSKAEGLMGMGFSTIANSKQPTFFENLMKQGKVKVNEFSFYLGRSKSHTQGASVMTLGGRDSSKYTGGFTKVPVTTKGYWQVKLDSVNVGGKSAGASTAGQAAIDTGTTLIIAPTAAQTAIFSQIPGSFQVPLAAGTSATAYAYPCDSKAIPSIVFNGKSFAINPLDFNIGKATVLFAQTIKSEALMNHLTNSPDGLIGNNCLAAIIGEDIKPAENLYVVGDSFLKNWYATFSYTPSASVQFAKAK